MYGTGTRSYNRSTENRQNKLARKEATERFLEARARGEVKPVTVSILCCCRSWVFPHEIAQHKQLSSDYDWPTPEERLQRQRRRQFWERPV